MNIENNLNMIIAFYGMAMESLIFGRSISYQVRWGNRFFSQGFDPIFYPSTLVSAVMMKYDFLSRLLEEHQQIGNQSIKSVASTYDKVGNRIKLVYPSVRIINIEPDELNRIRLVTCNQQSVTEYQYSGPFRVKERTYGNNSKLSIGYDANRRITNYGHRTTNHDLIVGFEHIYDKEDNKLYEKRSHDNNGDVFVYDSIYWLAGVKYRVPNLDPATDYTDYLTFDNKEEFQMDGVGNWQTGLN